MATSHSIDYDVADEVLIYERDGNVHSTDLWGEYNWQTVPTPFYIKLHCYSCGISSRKPAIYKRLSPVPENYDVRNLIMNQWSEHDPSGSNPGKVNEFKVDFNIFSSYTDGFADLNAWSFCDYDYSNMGCRYSL